MFIFDATKEMAINSDFITCMLIKELDSKDKKDNYSYAVIAAIDIDVKPKSLAVYYGKSKQDCINWIVTMNNKINSHRVIN